jgi:uncharacterized protein (TIGR00255 family)
LLAARLQRGHVDLSILYRNAREDAREVRVDAALLSAYQAAFGALAAAVPTQGAPSIMEYATLPGVLTVTEGEEDRGAVTALLEEALNAACDEVVAMRGREGETLRLDMLGKLARIEGMAGEIAARASSVPRAYQEKLQARLAELLAGPADPQRVAQEVAIFADRCAIDEELVRLGSHIGQLRGALADEEGVGRRLDFLIQELNREVNTIGSKASDPDLSARVVDIKGDIEKLREQVQNVE